MKKISKNPSVQAHVHKACRRAYASTLYGNRRSQVAICGKHRPRLNWSQYCFSKALLVHS